jgi:aspartyl-tRNA synthetase
MQRKYVEDVLKEKTGRVLVKGWVHETRDLGKVRFLLVRDITGIIQVTAHKDKSKEEIFGLMNLPRESVVSIEGKAVKSGKAPGGVEILPDKIEVLSEAKTKLPIDISDFSKTELPKRLDHRFLDFHRRKVQSVFKIQSEIANSFREFFYNKGFIEMQPPSVISAASEGGTELFPVKYFEKRAFLAQSPQLYKQMLACSIEKTFMITPVWRAEKHDTPRHLNEARQMDIEMAFAGQPEVMKELENVTKHMVGQVIKKCEKELEILKIKLKVPKAKYMSYDDAVKLLGIEYEEDLSPENEKKLGEKFPDTIVFVHSWPLSLKPFYIMPKDEKAKLSGGFDAIYKGIEISSGGQRIHIPELLIKRLRAKKLDPKNFKNYIDSFRFGSPIHSGWSIGLERFTMSLLELDNIREACMFPRDRDRLTP